MPETELHRGEDGARAEDRLRGLKNRSLPGEVWGFLRDRKAWWLLPTALLLVIIGGLIILANSSFLSSYVYMLF